MQGNDYRLRRPQSSDEGKNALPGHSASHCKEEEKKQRGQIYDKLCVTIIFAVILPCALVAGTWP
jgi:hypothetical protein